MAKVFSCITSEGHRPYTGVDKITIEVNEDATTSEMCEAFTAFLRACGYVFDGDIQIVAPDLEDHEEAPYDVETVRSCHGAKRNKKVRRV
jgi:hypothetical protein